MPSINYNGKRRFNQLISNDAIGDDTVKLIVKTINEDSVKPFIKETADLIKAKAPDRISFLKHLFAIACKSVKYLADEPGHEVVYTSLLLIRMGEGDCKKFTTFIGAVLKAAGYDGVPKVVKYSNDSDWQHIYIISRDPDNKENYITMDPVNHCRYNKEVRYSKARLNYLDNTYSPILMGNKLSLMGNLGNENDFISGMGDGADSLLDNLQHISGGVGRKHPSYTYSADHSGNSYCSCPQHNKPTVRNLHAAYIHGINDENQIFGDEDMNGISGIGKKKAAKSGSKKAPKTKASKAKRQEHRKKFFKKVFKGAKKFSPALASMRASFLLLVKIGGALQKMKKLHINLAKHLADAYSTPAGGKELNDIWEKFGGDEKTLKKAIIKAGKSSMKGTEDQDYMSGIFGPELAVPAAITAASPIIIAVVKMLKKNGKIPPEQADSLQDNIETAENVASNVQSNGGSLLPAAAEALQKSPLMRESLQEDSGGNPRAVQEVMDHADQVDEAGNFKDGAAQGRNAASNSEASETGRTKQTPTEIDNALLPVNLKDTPQAQGVKSSFDSLWNPVVWVRITLLIVIVCEFLKVPHAVTNLFTTISLSAMVFTIAKLFLKPNIYKNGKR